MGKQSEKMAAALESMMPQQAESPVTDESAGQDIEQARVTDESAPHAVQNVAERMAIIEALIFVSDEPLSARTIAEVLKEDREAVEQAAAQLAAHRTRRGDQDMRRDPEPSPTESLRASARLSRKITGEVFRTSCLQSVWRRLKPNQPERVIATSIRIVAGTVQRLPVGC